MDNTASPESRTDEWREKRRDVGASRGRDRLTKRTTAIMAEWTCERDDATRIKNLTDGTGSRDRSNGQIFLTDQTIHDDAVAVVFTGSAGEDWFFLNLGSGQE